MEECWSVYIIVQNRQPTQSKTRVCYGTHEGIWAQYVIVPAHKCTDTLGNTPPVLMKAPHAKSKSISPTRCTGWHHKTESSGKSVSASLAHGCFEWYSRCFISKSIPEKRRLCLPVISTIRLQTAAIQALPISPSQSSSSSDKPELNWSAQHHTLL